MIGIDVAAVKASISRFSWPKLKAELLRLRKIEAEVEVLREEVARLTNKTNSQKSRIFILNYALCHSMTEEEAEDAMSP